jgi:hypothetical protein
MERLAPSWPGDDDPNRRDFLRAAVAGSAAIAAVAGTHAALAATGGTASALGPQFLGTGVSPAAGPSGNIVFQACFEDSCYEVTPSFTVNSHGGTSPGTFFLWMTAYDLPPGIQFSMSVTQSAPDGEGGTPTDTSTPFNLAAAGNSVFLYAVKANSANHCPKSEPVGSFAEHHGFTDGGVGFQVPGSVRQDVLLKVHLKWNDGKLTTPKEVITIAGKLSVNGATIATASVSTTATQ